MKTIVFEWEETSLWNEDNNLAAGHQLQPRFPSYTLKKELNMSLDKHRVSALNSTMGVNAMIGKFLQWQSQMAKLVEWVLHDL